MAKRMLIDAAHPEETRVVVLNGQRLEEFDFETSTKKQIKGNIYLAKVTRVEPSLQAAFVEYGGNRHGFLAFSEIHPDYYRIPIADRQAALDADRAAQEAEDDREEETVASGGRRSLDSPAEMVRAAQDDQPDSELAGESDEQSDDLAPEDSALDFQPPAEASDALAVDLMPPPEQATSESFVEGAAAPPMGESQAATAEESDAIGHVQSVEAPVSIETVGGDEIEETTRPRSRPYRHYKIQEVIKRRQIMLVQVTKEERGNKGAALTTYMSLAGRYCVLMPNTPRGGGVSRKITSMTDRRRLKELMSDLEVPEGMGVIVRTAGSERSKTEIKRDFEYLLRLWDEIRDLTFRSTAPALIYEEGNLIKRSIRDLYARDIDEVIVDGEEGYRTAKAFMKMLMPSHSKRVKPYHDPLVPLFHRFQVEGQIDAIHSPVVQLRSGGYIVINPTEALVAIDVNSGRSTKERNIEETAYKTNIEASDEIARELRLRDLAGLIVIDFIDMEEHRNQGAVERRLKEAMRYDRARIQLGRISPFGLLELSRQRLRPSLLEASTQPCPHCAGTGHIRSTESTALHVLRAIEEEGMRRRTAEVSVAVPSAIALYILNQKRAALTHTESRYGFSVAITEDNSLVPPAFRLDRQRALTAAEIAALPVHVPPPPEIEEDDDDIPEDDEIEATDNSDTAAPEESAAEGDAGEETATAGSEEEGGVRRRRRRRRRGEKSRDDRPSQDDAPPLLALAVDSLPTDPQEGDEAEDDDADIAAQGVAEDQPTGEAEANDGDRKRRRRGRRGGRRRRRGGEEGDEAHAQGDAPDQGDAESAHTATQDTDGTSEPQDTDGTVLAETGMAWSPEIVAFPPDATDEAAPMAEAFQETAAPADHSGVDSLPVAELEISAPPPAEPTIAAEEAKPPEAERAPIQYNVPPPHNVDEPPAAPRRGWWRR